MNYQGENISLNLSRFQDTLVMNLKPSGRPSDDDFDKLSNMIETAVYSIQAPHMALLVDLSELQGVSAHSAWRELLHSLKIGCEFDRIAVFGHNHWRNLMINALSWLISPNLKVFQRKDEATNWVMAP